MGRKYKKWKESTVVAFRLSLIDHNRLLELMNETKESKSKILRSIVKGGLTDYGFNVQTERIERISVEADSSFELQKKFDCFKCRKITLHVHIREGIYECTKCNTLGLLIEGGKLHYIPKRTYEELYP